MSINRPRSSTGEGGPASLKPWNPVTSYLIPLPEPFRGRNNDSEELNEMKMRVRRLDVYEFLVEIMVTGMVTVASLLNFVSSNEIFGRVQLPM